MADKCFCHFNGYAVKDAQARADIETLKDSVSEMGSKPITHIKEMNNGELIGLWVGTTAEFQKETEPLDNVQVIITDDNTAEELKENIERTSERISLAESRLSINENNINRISGEVQNMDSKMDILEEQVIDSDNRLSSIENRKEVVIFDKDMSGEIAYGELSTPILIPQLANYSIVKINAQACWGVCSVNLDPTTNNCRISGIGVGVMSDSDSPIFAVVNLNGSYDAVTGNVNISDNSSALLNFINPDSANPSGAVIIKIIGIY